MKHTIPSDRTFLIRTLTGLLLLLLLPASLPARESMRHYFRTIDVRDGLSQNTVYQIMQDRQGFMWFATQHGLNRYDGLQFKVYKKNNSTLGRNFITVLYEDREGYIWVGTDGGLFRYDPQKDAFCDFNQLAQVDGPVTDLVTAIQEDAEGNIWFSVENQGLYCYHPQEQTTQLYLDDQAIPNVNFFWLHDETCWVALYADNLYSAPVDFQGEMRPFADADGKETFKGDIIYKQVEGPHNFIYIASQRGLFEYNRTNGKVRQLISAFVRTIQFQDDESLWVGTENGIYIYNLRSDRATHITASGQEDQYALSDNAIYAICRDRENGIWIGSYFGGVNYCPYQWTYFKKFYPCEGMNGFGRRVREIIPGNDGQLWIGTEDKGLFRFNPATETLTPFEHPLLYKNVHGLCMDGDYLWVGTFSGGLNRIDLRTRQVRHYEKGDRPNSLMANDVFTICRTSQNEIWIGTTSGLMKYNRATDDFTRVEQLQNKFVYYILEDFNGNLWLATYSHGVYCYDVTKQTWRNYQTDKSSPHSLPYNKVISIFEDSRKRLWFMTLGEGICQYIPEEDHFLRYDTLPGIEGNIVYKMMEDKKGNLWCSTNNGLVCFNPSNSYSHVYTTANGLLNNQFNYQSGYADPRGNIYVGSIGGFVVFNPDSFIENVCQPSVTLTQFYLNNNLITSESPGSPLTANISYCDEITLEANQNSFSLRAASLSYQAPEMNRISYRLQGYDKKWYEQQGNAVITYANLPSGRYKLHLKGANSDGRWSETEKMLTIRILPPFYLSGWAYALYCILACALTSCVVLYFRRKNLRKHQRAMEKFEHEKERELYTAKIEFFTNVAHEIRTPLTLIKSPLENVLAQGDLPDKIKDDLEIMDLNTNRLLFLVNQLLDFRKTEKKGFKLSFVEADVARLLADTCRRFKPQAVRKGADFTVEAPDRLMASVDCEGFTKIVSNLLTNAIKYGDSYVRLHLTDEEVDVLRLEVHNDGQVVPLQMREEIFKPFTRYDDEGGNTKPGTGIGLALARSLAELHGGTLRMSDVTHENCFVLTLPVRHAEAIGMERKEKDTPGMAELPQEAVAGGEVSGSGRRYTLLLVEDSPDMLSFVSRQLSGNYQILTATNGEDALALLKEHSVNLVISDIMMPKMDGLELCQRLKQEMEYSHIPVILLTAKTTLQAKIEGMKRGADAYIEKPFSVEYLKVCVGNLLKNREMLRSSLAHSPFIQTNSMAMTKADEVFLKSLKDVVDENMQNPDFGLDEMAAQLNMSRSSLNRKIKGILDMTPNDYIRLERLKKAAQLLKESGCRINEVCYMTGFNTPSYFAKCFQKQFGVLPKDFANTNQQGATADE